MRTMAEIISAIRREIREPSPVTISDTEIEGFVLEGMDFLWDALVMADDTLAMTKGILYSASYEYALPTDFDHIKAVNDPMRRGYMIDGFTPATAVISITGHPYNDGDLLIVDGLEGVGTKSTVTTDGESTLRNNRLNGVIHTVTVSGDNITLLNTAVVGTYESGTGSVIKWDTNYRKLNPISPLDSYKRNKYEYYITGNMLIRDKEDFYQAGVQQWLVIDYVRRPSWKVRTGLDPNYLSDIPRRFHYALESYGVIRSIRIPEEGTGLFTQMKEKLTFHQNQWDKTLDVIAATSRSSEPRRFRDNIKWNSLW